MQTDKNRKMLISLEEESNKRVTSHLFKTFVTEESLGEIVEYRSYADSPKYLVVPFWINEGKDLITLRIDSKLFERLIAKYTQLKLGSPSMTVTGEYDANLVCSSDNS